MSSVNSPIKPLTQNTNKDGTPKEPMSARKTSISHGGGTPYGISSPTTNRPSNRRRETNDAYPFPSTNTASPSVSRFSREESNTVAPPPALMRRRTDFKEPAGGSTDDRDKDKSGTETSGPFAGLKRTTTAPFAAAGATSWGTTSPASAFSTMGAFGSFAAPPAEKKPGYGSLRGESRFKGLMGKASTENFAKAPREKPSLRDLNKASAAEGFKTPSWMEARASRPVSNDTDPTDEIRTGSAALLGGADTSPTEGQGFNNFGTPQKRDQRDQSGFATFGMPTGDSTLRDIFSPPSSYQQTPQQQRAPGGQEPMSPTDTNPYQSPEHERPPLGDDDSDGGDVQQHFPGMGSFQIDSRAGHGQPSHGFGGLPGLGRVSQPYEVAPSDRSQTSSVGPSRGFAPLPGLGSLSGLGGSSAWGPPPQAIGTPVRERGNFDLFGASNDAQSPGLPGLGSNALFAGASGLGGPGTIGRTSSRLGSLFPQAMQDQMRQGDQRQGEEGAQDDRLHSLTGTFGRGAFGSQAPGSSIPARDTASPLRRGLFDAFSGTHASMDDSKRDAHEPTTPFGQLSGGPSQPSVFSAAPSNMNSVRTAIPTTSQPPGISTPTGQPPAPQQRTMVMPDRMRWIYRDPEGRTQGPFSGLEMHDWYKAGFFSPELLVKKFEDPEYEPLAQLIRRIGNSREPFLVPQIGIPHGPPTTQSGNAWAGSGLTAGPGTGGAQPPFANNFPTFGTTLTAEQQNALERRKQEEQYLMAQQKDFLAIRQQALAKQTQLGGIGHGVLPHQLHNHSSGNSLHSQPSYSGITTPGGYQTAPIQGPLAGGPAPVPGLFDSFRAPPVPGLGPIGPGMDMHSMRDEDTAAMMERLQIGRTGQPQPPFGTAQLPLGQQPDSNAHAQQVIDTYLGDRARLQREQEQHDQLQRTSQNEQQAAQASADRLQQFHDLRLQTNVEQAPVGPPEGVIGKPTAPAAEPQQQQVQHEEEEEQPPQKQQQQTSQKQKQKQQEVASAVSPPAKQAKPAKAEPLSLTEQVQKTQAKQTPTQAAWGKVEPAIHPFPPPPSQSPLPAPAAQRKPIVADSLSGESRSQSATPSVETPSASIAPWAKEPTEAPKGPSLKEIQEAEAKKAAEREAIAAAARREAAEKELLAQAQSPAAQPGLPTTATWGSTGSPSTPVGAGVSAWAKPAAGKATGATGTAAKKTLQQIQKEEEARKLRQAQAQAQAAAAAQNSAFSPSPALASGKRYADLASKPTASTPSTSGAWTTVGASGKVKAPVASPVAPAAIRTPIATPAMTKKTIVTRSSTASVTSAKASAEEEFKKWAINELRGELNKDINSTYTFLPLP